MESWTFKVFRRGQDGYEAARVGACWNGRVPERYPELITLPECAEHVQDIVRYAKGKKLTIGTKSGGHSWTASFLRDGGILVDLEKMKKFNFDVTNRTAEVQPAVYGSDLNEELLKHDLFFPAGHCPTVGLGGFLLQGGFGWNSRKWGVACESVLAIDLVTAEGDLIHADASQNSDFYWAARGAGCGYFGLITKFYLRLHPLPKGIMTARYVFELENLDEVLSAVDDASGRSPPDLELSFFVSADQDGFMGRTTLAIVADALCETQEEARKALDIIHNLPPMRKSIKAMTYISCTVKEMLARYDDILDNRGRRYECNNLWTDEPVQPLLPSFHEIIKNLGPAPTHLFGLWWVPVRDRPEMAFSLEGRLYVAVYAISTEPSKDAMHSHLVVRSIDLMDRYKKGIQLADENLPAAPGKFMKTKNYVHLERLRRKHDPAGRFYGYMRVPEEFEKAWASI